MKKRILYIILGVMLLSVKGMGQDIFGIVSPQTLTYKGNGNVPTVGITLGCYVDLVTNYTSTDGAGYSSSSAPKNVGSYHLSLSFVPLSPCAGTGDIDFAITQKSLTMTGLSVPSSKIYDGTVNAVVTDVKALLGTEAAGAGSTSDGKPYSVDAVSLTGTAVGTYNTKDVATATTVTYTGISLTGTGSGNYALTIQSPSAATITQKSLIITALDKSKSYGSANPILTVAYTGLVNGDVAPIITLSTTALASSPVGTYPITATGAIDANYVINYVAGTLTVTKVALTITAADKSKSYGTANPVLTVAYTGLVNGDAAPITLPTISTTALASSIVGTYPITASAAADPNYTISYVAGTLTVTKVALTITAADKSKLYGSANPVLTVAYTGLVNGDLAPTTLPAISTTAVLSSAAGTYPISVSSAADANYTINYVAGTLTVTKVPLIITADNKTKVYGAANPILTYTYSGLVNGDLATATWPTILTTAVANSPAGTYPIIPSAATDANYTITYVEGTLTVTKAPLTITAKPHTITYNGTAYTGGNGVVATGLISGETISNLTGTLTYAGTSQGAKNVGTYTIIPDGLSSPNYNINYVGDNLEIKKATLNVIAGDQSVNFGTELAKILNDAVYTYTGLAGGDNASAIAGAVSYSTNYTPLTSTGASGIYLEPIITGLSATNYDIIAVKGTITITAPPASPVFQIPNAFTPNSDGHNDTFKIIENGYVTSIKEFKIFTKSGKLIFSDKDGAWDGRYAGVMLDSDVYIWIADFINKNNGTEHLSGTVLLLK